MNRLLSVIVPVYNSEKYLPDCIEGIINQSYKNIELILIDDGSADSSGDICDKYAAKDKRIRVIHKENSGWSDAKNLGLSEANGDLIAFSDNDDVIDGDMYEILINSLIDTNSDAAAAGYKKEYASIMPINKHPEIPSPSIIHGGKQLYENIIGKGSNEIKSIEGMTWNKVYRRKLIGKHRYKKQYSIVDDAVFTIDVMENAKQVAFIDLPMYHWRQLSSSGTHSSNYMRYLDCVAGYEYMIKKVKPISMNAYIDLIHGYILWNTTAFSHLINEEEPDMGVYRQIVDNLKSVKEYINSAPFVYKIQSEAIINNYNLGKTVVKLKKMIKRF